MSRRHEERALEIVKSRHRRFIAGGRQARCVSAGRKNQKSSQQCRGNGWYQPAAAANQLPQDHSSSRQQRQKPTARKRNYDSTDYQKNGENINDLHDSIARAERQRKRQWKHGNEVQRKIVGIIKHPANRSFNSQALDREVAKAVIVYGVEAQDTRRK